MQFNLNIFFSSKITLLFISKKKYAFNFVRRFVDNCVLQIGAFILTKKKQINTFSSLNYFKIASKLHFSVFLILIQKNYFYHPSFL